MFTRQPQQTLTEPQLASLAMQGNEQLTQAALQEMLVAQQGMQEVAAAQNIEVPKLISILAAILTRERLVVKT